MLGTTLQEEDIHCASARGFFPSSFQKIQQTIQTPELENNSSLDLHHNESATDETQNVRDPINVLAQGMHRVARALFLKKVWPLSSLLRVADEFRGPRID